MRVCLGSWSRSATTSLTARLWRRPQAVSPIKLAQALEALEDIHLARSLAAADFPQF